MRLRSCQSFKNFIGVNVSIIQVEAGIERERERELTEDRGRMKISIF